MLTTQIRDNSLSEHRTDLSSGRFAVTGSSGLVGTALIRAIEARGGTALRLSRKSSVTRDQRSLLWDPASGIHDMSGFPGVDAVVHLAGENIASGRWTEAKKQRIRDSRVIGTRRLCESLAALPTRPEVLICASAIGFYGDRGAQVVSEADESGSGFLPDVCRQWEQATQPAAEAGIRVVNLRIGVVLAREAGALKEMLLPFRLGLGGRIGAGSQYWSWISLPDLVRAILFTADTPALAGPVNAVAPEAATNTEFTRVLGRVLRRPTVFPLPAFVARLVLGEMARDLLLASIRVAPDQLHHHGFQFQHAELEPALRFILGPKVRPAT